MRCEPDFFGGEASVGSRPGSLRNPAEVRAHSQKWIPFWLRTSGACRTPCARVLIDHRRFGNLERAKRVPKGQQSLVGSKRREGLRWAGDMQRIGPP